MFYVATVAPLRVILSCSWLMGMSSNAVGSPSLLLRFSILASFCGFDG